MHKSFLQSKTLWLNVIGALLTIISATEFQQVLPATAIPYIGLAVMVGNVILRSLKDQKDLALAMPASVEIMNARVGYRPPAA